MTLSPSYAAARRSFLAAAEAAGARITSHPHPLKGLDAEELAVDVAELGDPAALNLAVIVSGTHGVEGYAGSALQTAWLQTRAGSIPAGTGVVLVHALNPYGMSWVRRVNEDNVDLNRNFVDWSAPAPRNLEYDALADDLVPGEWTAASQEQTTGRLITAAGEMGIPAFQKAVSGGQFHHPTGIFYGGVRPVWSHRWLVSWWASRMHGVARGAVVDLHTGLGPWGVGELLASETIDAPATRRALEWWGEVTSVSDGASVSAPIDGDWLAAAPRFEPRPELTSIAIEYGNRDPFSGMQALRADAWLHAHGDPTAPEAADIRAAVRAEYNDDDPSWFAALWPRFETVVDAALAHLS